MGQWNFATIQQIAAWFCGPEGFSGKYSQGTYKECPLCDNMKVRSDCSGFVSAYLFACGFNPNKTMFCSASFKADAEAAKVLSGAGWQSIPYDPTSMSGRQPGDIVRVNGHIYIVAEEVGMRYDNGNNRPNGMKVKDWPDDGAHTPKDGTELIWRAPGMGAATATMGVAGKLIRNDSETTDIELTNAMCDLRKLLICGIFENNAEHLGTVKPNSSAKPDKYMEPQTLSFMDWGFETEFLNGQTLGIMVGGGALGDMGMPLGSFKYITIGILSAIIHMEGWTGGTPTESYHNWRNPCKAYHQEFDPDGCITVGPGVTNLATPQVIEDKEYSSQEVLAFFKGELLKLEKYFDTGGKYANIPTLGQRAVDAVISYMYNCGPGRSAAQISAARSAEELAEVLRNGPRTANGKELPGLVKRREAEAAYILTGSDPNHWFNGEIDADIQGIAAAMSGTTQAPPA